MQPHCVGLSSATAEGPFTSISTDRIFPFWLDFILKAMEVSSHNQLAWVMDIVIKAPEVLDGGEGVDGADGASPGCLLGLSLRVVEPEGPGVLERVRRGGVGLRRRVAGVRRRKRARWGGGFYAREDGRRGKTVKGAYG